MMIQLNHRLSLLSSCSACCVGQGSRAAASAPVSAVGKGWAAGWAPQRRHAAWRRTTCPPPARQEGDPVDLKQDAALHQASVVTQVKKLQCHVSGMISMVIPLVLIEWWIQFFAFCISEGCSADQSCLAEEEGDNQISQSEGSDDVLLRLLHLAGHTPPHRVRQWAASDARVHGGHLRDWLLGFVVQSNLVVVHWSINLFHLPTHLLASFSL